MSLRSPWTYCGRSELRSKTCQQKRQAPGCRAIRFRVARTVDAVGLAVDGVGETNSNEVKLSPDSWGLCSLKWATTIDKL